MCVNICMCMSVHVFVSVCSSVNKYVCLQDYMSVYNREFICECAWCEFKYMCDCVQVMDILTQSFLILGILC